MKKLLALLTVVGFSQYTNADDAVSGAWYAEFIGGLGVLSNDLSGTGFSSALPFTMGSDFGLKLGYEPGMQNLDYAVQYRGQAFTFETPSSISPAKINATRSETQLLAKMTPFLTGWQKEITLGVGYQFVNYVADVTTPNVVMTGQTVSGIYLTGEYNVTFNEDINSVLNIGLFLPHSFSESNAQTGYGFKFLGYSFGIDFEWRLSETWMFMTGMQFQHEQISFSGTGDRSVSDATDGRSLITIPIKARWNFY
jgi:hypothetical protein